MVSVGMGGAGLVSVGPVSSAAVEVRPQRAPDATCAASVTAAPLSAPAAESLARTFKAVAEPTRLRLLSIIAAQPDGEACVCDLTAPVGLSQPTVSHHLKVLVDAGLLTRQKRGVWVFYALVPHTLGELALVLTPR